MRGEFYKMEYEAWDEGTDTLTLEQEGAYLRFCHQMYRRKSPVVDDKAVLARLWKCHPNKAVKLRADLIEAGKIGLTDDGYLTNTRVTQELDTRKTQSTHRSDAGRTGGIRSGEVRRKSLKNNDADEAIASSKTNQRREEERREESSEPTVLRSPRRHAWPKDYLDEFWRLYPKHVEKKPAMAALAIVYRSDNVPWQDIADGIERLKSCVDPKYHPYPAKWLKGERWADEHHPQRLDRRASLVGRNHDAPADRQSLSEGLHEIMEMIPDER